MDRKSSRVVKNPRGKLLSEESLWEIIPDYSFFDDNYYLYPFDGKLYRRLNF
jgi:hypothetical protein